MMRAMLISLLLASCAMSGCIFVPAIDAYNQMGLSKVDREKLLPKEVKKFQEALYWSQSQEALQYVREDRRAEVGPDLFKSLENTRVVESKTGSIEYDADSYKATVTVLVRFYKVPFYIVTDRTEKQVWEFTLSDGWKYVSKGELAK